MVEAVKLQISQEETTWQYRREKLPKLAATRDAATFGSSQHPGWSSAHIAANSISLTVSALIAVTTTAKRSSRRKKRKNCICSRGRTYMMRPYAFFGLKYEVLL